MFFINQHTHILSYASSCHQFYQIKGIWENANIEGTIYIKKNQIQYEFVKKNFMMLTHLNILSCSSHPQDCLVYIILTVYIYSVFDIKMPTTF